MRKYFAPGRINLIGEHIDYNGGMVLPAALSLGITAIVEHDTDGCIHLSSSTQQEALAVPLNKQHTFQPKNGWLNYPLGVIDFLQKRGFQLPALSIKYESNLPEGSGLSSSAAIEVLTMFLLLKEADVEISKPEIAVWCREVENKFIGVQCGIMDQFAVANCKADMALLLNCGTLEHKHIPADFGDFALMVMNTCKPRSLIHSKYNERKQECEEALNIINVKLSSPISFLCDANVEQLACIHDETLRKRALHVVTEQQRVLKAVEALSKKDVSLFAQLLNESHRSLKLDYEVSGFELDTIVHAAWEHPSCIGARMTGAGFGGCAIALVRKNDVYDFEQKVLQQYQKATGLQGVVHSCKLEDGVHEV